MSELALFEGLRAAVGWGDWWLTTRGDILVILATFSINGRRVEVGRSYRRDAISLDPNLEGLISREAELVTLELSLVRQRPELIS